MGEIFNYFIFKYLLRPFLSSPSETPIIWMLVHFTLSRRSLKLSSFLLITFPLFFFMVVISTTLSSSSFIYSSASFILLLIPSSVFFISVIVELGLGPLVSSAGSWRKSRGSCGFRNSLISLYDDDRAVFLPVNCLTWVVPALEPTGCWMEPSLGTKTPDSKRAHANEYSPISFVNSILVPRVSHIHTRSSHGHSKTRR